MIDFLIKSTISLIIFLSFYHLVLEREKMHQFNRFYLLFSIVISLVIPFITFEIIREIPVAAIMEPTYMPIPMSNETIPVIETIDYTPIVLWGLYGLTTLFLSIRFGKNIWQLITKSSSNPTVKHKNAQLVLVDEKILPHTFLNSIFINFDDYNQRNIEDELYTHELVHVTQKHTLDILFIEFLKTIFWFNPIFIFYKKAIQLNHEFLADEKVVESYNNVPFYQSLLLQKGNGNQVIYLASNLNYLVTKKRLLMMTKNTSKNIAFLKKIAIIPILAGLVFFICFKVVAQEKINPKAATAVAVSGVELSTSETDDKRRDIYYSGVRIMLKDYRYGIEINEMYEDLTLEQKRTYLNWIPSPMKENKITETLLTKLASTNKNAVWIDERVVTNSELKKHQSSDFKHYTASFVHKNARSKKFPQNYQYHLYTKDYFDKNLKNLHLKFSNDTLKIGVSNFHKPKNVKTLKKIKPDTIIWQTKNKEGYNLYIKDTVKKKAILPKKPLEKVTINGEIYEKVGEKYFNKKGSFDATGKTKFKDGYIKINNQTCFYVSNEKGEIKYFDPTGNRIDIYGIKTETKANTIEEVPTKKQETDVYNLSDLTEKPEFELGLEAFYKYIGSNYKIPEEVTKNKLKGRVFASFIVEKDGSLSNIKILRDMGYGTGEEAVRVLKESPKWKPGKKDGRTVRTMYSLPISIKSE
jgi:beta-lactamase regulating signal transducer with metallopeptidase domain